MNVEPSRRELLAGSVGAAAWIGLPGLRAAPASRDLEFREVGPEFIDGRGFDDVRTPFDRLPERARGVVREPVWGLSLDSAGLSFRFRSNSRALALRYRLRRPRLALPHMPATGVSGLDLYARHGERWHWLWCSKPQGTDVRVALEGLDGERREYLGYLPLYNGVELLELGVDEGSETELLPPPERREDPPIVFYGTSIAQGACASRPGMAFPSILGRRLGRRIVNLGFSGQGTLDLSMAELLVEIDAAAYVIDCLPNLNRKSVSERAEPFVRRLRESRPDTPIVLVEDRVNANAIFFEQRRDHHRFNHEALRVAYRRLAEELDGLHYLAGAGLIGSDGEGTVDGSHPTDVGMMRYADAYEPFLRSLLG